MKNIFLKILLGTITFAALHANAGKMKDIVIDTDDAIIEKLVQQGENSIDEISGHQFTDYTDGIAVQATASNYNSSWICTVYFKKTNENYSVEKINCK